ncbi:MAG TPA: hypothetical protein DCQ48_06825, partial [Erythrobacter sp.]|nr:hypothetical protein [Erythrobacter sp.]
MIKTPWHSRLAFALALALPVYFAIAALGTKFGLWDWRTGLLTLTIKAGPILLGIVALIGLISLIVVLLRKPRKGWLLSLIALLVPVGIFAVLGAILGGVATPTEAASVGAIGAMLMAGVRQGANRNLV